MAALNMRPYFRGQSSDPQYSNTFSLPVLNRFVAQPTSHDSRTWSGLLPQISTKHSAPELTQAVLKPSEDDIKASAMILNSMSITLS
jgi:hypothetical protein